MPTMANGIPYRHENGHRYRTRAFYYDGRFVATDTDSRTLSATSLFRLGATSDTSGFFPGSLDDVRIYNRALSAQEAQQLFLMGH